MAPRCTLCSLHSEVKSVLIPYRGKSSTPNILFVGIAPAREEDQQNKNFVGPAGRLLFDIIEELDIDTDECGFDNLMHCATLHNGFVIDPTPEQVLTCSAYLYWKIKQVRPRVIVTLGNIPTRELIDPETFISDVHGRNFTVSIGGDPYTIIPTFHPSAVLRGNTEYRDQIKADIHHAWRTATGQYWMPSVEVLGDTQSCVARILDIGDKFVAGKIAFAASDSETNSIILKNSQREKEGVELIDKLLYSNEGKIICLALSTVDKIKFDLSGDFSDGQRATYREGATKYKTGFTIPLLHKDSPVDPEPVVRALRQVFGRKTENKRNLGVPMAFHNHKYDGSWYSEKLGFFPHLYHDTMLGDMAIYGNSRKHGLEGILFRDLLMEQYKNDTNGPLQALPPAQRHFGNLPLELIGERCAIDTVGCAILTPLQLAAVKRLKREVMMELLRDSSEKFTLTELRGNFLDTERFNHYLETYPKLLQAELDYLDKFPQVQLWKMMHPGKKYKPHYYNDRSEVMYRIFNLPTEFAGDDPSYHKNDKEEENPYWSTNEPVQYRLILHCRAKVTKEQKDPKTKQVMLNDKGLPMTYEEYVPAPYTGKCSCRALDDRLEEDEDHTPENYKRLGINPHTAALDYLVRQRKYSKIKTVDGNFLRKLLRYIRPPEWHQKEGLGEEVQATLYSYLLHYVASGRLSMRDFPMHTFPWHSDPRRCFVSRHFKQGGLLLSTDYSQLELRMVACLANDEVMIQAYRDGEDLHRITAAACWQVKPEQVTGAMRRYAKTISFRVIYGGGAKNISEEVGISVKEAQRIIDNWLNKYHGVAKFIQACHDEAITTGQVLSIFGLIFSIPNAKLTDTHSQDFQAAMRESQNLPVQGCLIGSTRIPLLNGQTKTLKQLAEERPHHEWVYSFNIERGEIVPGFGYDFNKTGRKVEVWTVELDNGEKLTGTPDHLFLLKTGEYRELSKLRSGDSIEPLYRKDGPKGYEYIHTQHGWRATHRVVAGSFYDVELKHDDEFVVHHASFDKRNNDPTQLWIMDEETHGRLHREFQGSWSHSWQNPDIRKRWVAKAKKHAQEFLNTPKIRARAAATKLDHGSVHWQRVQEFNRNHPNGRPDISADDVFSVVVSGVTLLNDVALALDCSASVVKKRATESTGCANWSEYVYLMTGEVNARNGSYSFSNHKVVAVYQSGYEDVYDFSVDKHHNYATDAGVFVHNTGSYITMTAYNLLYQALLDDGMQSRPWMMIHDANEVDVFPHVDELYKCYQYSKYFMEDKVMALYPWLNVPMKTEAELGARWDGSPVVESFTPECLKVYGRVPFIMEIISQLRKFSKFRVVYYAVRNKKECDHSPKLTLAQMVAVEKGEEIVIKKSYEGDSGGDWDTGAEIYFDRPLKAARL